MPCLTHGRDAHDTNLNLILFEPHELDSPLPRGDRRAAHIIDVLRRRAGETFDVGLLNGPRGKATLAAATPEALTLTFAWGPPPAPIATPITLVVGLPRPQTARDILRDATTLGVAALHFVRTEKSDPSYAASTLWSTGEWRRHTIAGAEQAFDTRVPEVAHGDTLAETLATVAPVSGSAASVPATRLALDNYESPRRLGECQLLVDTAIVLAVGPERGWSAMERMRLREHGFAFAHLGERALRTESAVIAALSILRAKRGLM